jgi:hypothetical protein
MYSAMSFLGLSSKENNAKRLGDLKGEKNIPEQLHDLGGKFKKTIDKNTSELQKCRELTKFNENLTKSYVANLKVITDISNLLKAYNEFFEIFKTKLSEIDEELGMPISTDDFEYMKKLTNEQLVQIDGLFKNETSSLKKLYSRYDKQKEYDQVESAEKLFEDMKQSGDQVNQVLQQKVGGAKQPKKRVSKPKNGKVKK